MSAEPEQVEADESVDLTVPAESDNGLVRRLRRQLKDQAREAAELRRTVERLGSDGESKSAVPKGLREAYRAAVRERDELRAAQRGQSLKAAFDEAGVPPGPLRDLLGEKIKGDGDVSVESLQEWMAEAGIQRFDPVGAHRSASTQRIDELRAASVPVGSQKLGYQDYQQLHIANPSAAAQALAQGQVEIPGHIAATLQANRDERERGVFGG